MKRYNHETREAVDEGRQLSFLVFVMKLGKGMRLHFDFDSILDDCEMKNLFGILSFLDPYSLYVVDVHDHANLMLFVSSHSSLRPQSTSRSFWNESGSLNTNNDINFTKQGNFALT
jgi:hypothetical protein